MRPRLDGHVASQQMTIACSVTLQFSPIFRLFGIYTASIPCRSQFLGTLFTSFMKNKDLREGQSEVQI